MKPSAKCFIYGNLLSGILNMRSIVGPKIGPDIPLTTAKTKMADVFPPIFSVDSCASASVTLLGGTARLIVADIPRAEQRGG